MVLTIRTEIRASFKDSEDPIDTSNMGVFSRNFAALHNAIVKLSERDEETEEALTWDEESLARIRHSSLWSRWWFDKVAYSYFVEHGKYLDHEKRIHEQKWLQITSMRKESPLDIIFTAVPLALTAAVIFSGGSIEMPHFKARLPPIGSGIKAIRNAMKDGNKKRVR